MQVRVRTARRHVAAARLALRSSRPEDILPCLLLLEEAIVDMRALKEELGQHAAPPLELARELTELSQELTIVRRAVEHNLSVQLEWARILGTAAGGYTAAGEATPLKTLASSAVLVSVAG